MRSGHENYLTHLMVFAQKIAQSPFLGLIIMIDDVEICKLKDMKKLKKNYHWHNLNQLDKLLGMILDRKIYPMNPLQNPIGGHFVFLGNLE